MSKFKTFLETILAVLFTGLLLMVTWQVVSRYVLSDPSTVTEEVSRFLLIWLIFFGATYTFMERGHLAFELFLEKFENQFPMRRIVAFLILFLGLILIVGGSILVYTIFSLGQKTAVLGIPMGFIYLAAPINGLLIAIFGASEFLSDTQTSEGDK